MHPRCNRPTPYIREADAERYRAIVREGSARNTGFLSSERSRDRVYEAVARRKSEPVSTAELAAELELPEETCKRIAHKLFSKGVLKRDGRGTAYHPYRYFATPSLGAATVSGTRPFYKNPGKPV